MRLEKTLHQISDSLHQPFVVTDPRGAVLWVNEAFTQMCGHSTEQLAGKKPGEVLQGPKTSAATAARISEALRDEKPFSGKILNYHAEGHEYWVELDITPLRDETGALRYFIAFEHEIPTPDIGTPSLCMFCKRYKDQSSGSWISNEEFLIQKLRLHPSHGICPLCVSRCFDEQ